MMTSLFFIMLVLFVVTIASLIADREKQKIKNKATENELNKIKQIKASVETLDTNYFKRENQFNRYILKQDIQFKPGKWDLNDPINNLVCIRDTSYIAETGKAMKKFIDDIRYKKENYSTTKMVLVIKSKISSNNTSQYECINRKI